MRRSFFFVLICLACVLPGTVTGSHPAHPSAVERSWAGALRERLQSMKPEERKELKSSLRNEWRQFKKQRKDGSEADVSTLLLTLIALILPPLAVYLHQGAINSKFWISLLLTLLIWVPGVIYALLVIFGVIS